MDSCVNSRETSTVNVIVLTCLVVILAIGCGLSWKWIGGERTTTVHVPFVVVGSSAPLAWKDLGKALSQHENEVSFCLRGLSRSLEVALSSEQDLGLPPLLSKRLQDRIDRLAPILDHDANVLRQWLKPFPVVQVLADKPHDNSRPSSNKNNNNNKGHGRVDKETTSRMHHQTVSESTVASSYETSSQVVAHVVRDWTPLGARLRQSMYNWCRRQLRTAPTKAFVLVPGAGMGRLAFDVAALDGHSVEANDSSLMMAAAAHHLWHAIDNKEWTLHPFALDYFTNEVNSQERYQKFVVQSPSSFGMRGSLSYTIGDFCEIYGAIQEPRYHAIITCFFLDTAKNVYEYLSIIHNLLLPGGQWIHVGPLQWHSNAQLHPAADELRELVEGMGFRVRHWSQDRQPMDYRLDPHKGRQSTKFEGFRPLRISAIKKDTPRGVPYPTMPSNDDNNALDRHTPQSIPSPTVPRNDHDDDTFDPSPPKSTVVIEEL